MPGFWPSLPDGTDYYTDVNGERKCPGCSLTGAVGVDCINKNLHLSVCYDVIRPWDGDTDEMPFEAYRVYNTAAWETHGTDDEVHQEFYIEGDAEAHDPEIGPGNGEPIDP